MSGTLHKSVNLKSRRSPKKMRSVGSTRKALRFNSNDKLERVNTMHKTLHKRTNRSKYAIRSLGSTRKTLRFSKSRTKNNKSRKRPNLGPPRRVLIMKNNKKSRRIKGSPRRVLIMKNNKKSRRIKGSPRRVKKTVRRVKTPWRKYGGKSIRRKRRGGNHSGLFW